MRLGRFLLRSAEMWCIIRLKKTDERRVKTANTMHYLSEYQTFQSVAELNAAVKSHLYANNFDLNDTDKDVITVIAQHAAKYPGVAHLKAATIADKVGKSVITIRRVINKLVNFGIVEKVPTLRKVSGGKGANILRILPHDKSAMTSRKEPEKTHDNNVEQPKNETETSTLLSYENKNNISNTNTYQADEPRRKSPYMRFKSYVENFVSDSKLANRLYGIYLAQTKPLKQTFNADQLLETALESLKTAFMSTKRKRIRNIAGYFNGTLDRMLDKLYFEEVEEFLEKEDGKTFDEYNHIWAYQNMR